MTFEVGVGEVNGLALAPDGRLVVGVSRRRCLHARLEAAAAVLTVRTDGTDLTVLASGIRAPVGLAYVPDTDDLLVTMNQRDDLGDATPGDWLALVRVAKRGGSPIATAGRRGGVRECRRLSRSSTSTPRSAASPS